MPAWYHVDHDADIGIVGIGETLADAFEQVAIGMTGIVTATPIARDVELRVSCNAPDYAWGEAVDRDRHQPAVEVKGATLTEVDVQRDEDGVWHARCVVDV